MRLILRVLATAWLLTACGSDSQSEPTDASDGSDEPACPNLAGAWSVGFRCGSPTMSASGRSPLNSIGQDGCDLVLTQKDDNTPREWTSVGSVDGAGSFTLTGTFGFGPVTECTGQVAGDSWTASCVEGTTTCTLDAERR